MKFDELTAAERLIAEQAVLNLRSLNKACDNAVDGTVLAIGEVMAVEQGRRFTQKTLQAAMDEQIKTLEKSSPARFCICGLKEAHHGRKARRLTTAAGDVRLSRIYLKCVRCEDGGGFVADGRLGVDGRYSMGAERLACLAVGSWSHEISAERLNELCGLSLAANTIRDIAQKHGATMNSWQNTDPEACREFRETDGETEVTTDGTCVNTLTGWREMKVEYLQSEPPVSRRAPKNGPAVIFHHHR